MTDWKKIAQRQNLTPAQFRNEILTVAACVGALELDKNGATPDEAMRFSCHDEVGEIEVYIKRVKEQQKMNQIKAMREGWDD